MKKQHLGAPAKPARSGKSRTGKALLAAACGMLGTGGAQAGVVSEPPDFSNVLTSPTVLPTGTNQVSGHVGNSDRNDTFRFDDLGGATGTIEINYSLVSRQINEYGLTLSFYNASGTYLGASYVGSTDPLVGSVLLNVPVDGRLTARVNQDQDDSGEGTGYTLGFDVADTPSGVPSPGTGALAALGAAALFARRRRKPRGA